MNRAVVAIMLIWAAGTSSTPASGTGPSIAELVEVADITSLAASPDGRRLAFRVEAPSIQRNSYILHWYVADLATGAVRRVGGGGEPIYGDGGPMEVEPAFWSSDSFFFYHRALVDGAIGIWQTAADGSGSIPVVAGDADVEHLQPDPTGTALTYRLGPTRDEIARAERREYEDGILIAADVDLAQPLFRGGWVNGRMATQRLIGRWYARDGLLWASPRAEYRLDLRSLETSGPEPAPPRTVAPLPTRLDFSLSAVSESGHRAVADWSGTGASLVVDEENDIHRCRAQACRGDRIVALAWRPGRREIVFTVQDRHNRQSLHLWSLDEASVRLIVQGDGLLSGSRASSVPCSITETSLVCVAASATSPPRLVQIDLDNGNQLTLFDPNPSLRNRDMPEVEHISWRLADGRLATGTLLLPRGQAQRAPLFLNYYHCAGYLRGGVGDEFPFAPLVDAGFVVACLNMLPFDSPQDGIGRYQAALASVESLVDSLSARGLVDPGRVGMGGFSAGSEATMWVAVHSQILAAAAIASPQYEPSSYWMDAARAPDRAGLMRDVFGLGAPDETPDTWSVVAPALNVDRIQAPLLMQLPEAEARSAVELLARLSRTATPVEMHAFPDEGHVKMQPRHRQATYRRSLDWFRYWLQDHIDSDPAKGDQYRRWHRFRENRQLKPAASR